MKKLFCLAAAVLLAGCSSVINGSSQEILFTGNAKEIKIKRDGVLLCTTPCSVFVKREENGIMLIAEKEGYDSVAIMLKSKLSFYFWGNIITGGLLGSTTDAVSGGMWEYVPDQYYIHLTKGGKTNQKELEVKQFVMKNFPHLKREVSFSRQRNTSQRTRNAPRKTKRNNEYLQALSMLTGSDEQKLREKILTCNEAVFCAEKIAAEEEE